MVDVVDSGDLVGGSEQTEGGASHEKKIIFLENIIEFGIKIHLTHLDLVTDTFFSTVW